MIDPVDGKVIYPYADRMWARSVGNEVKLFRITEHTCIFLDAFESLHKATDLNLTDIQFDSALFPELFFEDRKYDRYARVFYGDHCWNIQTSGLYLNSKVMREAVVPFLEFMDKYAVRVDYKMVKEYLGLNNKERKNNGSCKR